MAVLKDKKGVQRLPGMCNLLSQFVSKLCEICAPLREISIMNAEFCGPASQQTAFTHIKEVITSATLLQYFDSAKPVILPVDASDNGLRGALLQENRPVAYTSSTMIKSQKDNYTA